MQQSPATLLEGMESYRKEVHVITTTTTDLSPFASFVSEMRALSLPPSFVPPSRSPGFHEQTAQTFAFNT